MDPTTQASATTRDSVATLSGEEHRMPTLPRNLDAVSDGQSERIRSRTIVICLDGTGDKFDADNSSIVHLVSCLKKSNPSQVTYYQSGIGTYNGGGLSNGVNAALDMAVGAGLGVHVRDAYKFLMQNYKQGDKICLFGFSRGAYTARCLAGMVHKVGLLPAHNVAQVPFAYEYYKNDTDEGWKMSREFKATFCMNVSIYFIGVFDSVASVGMIPRKLPLSSTPDNKAAYFRHAMALDEHRAKFKACRFKQKHGTGKGSWDVVAEDHNKTADQETKNGDAQKPRQELSRFNSAALAKAMAGPTETDVREVWFTGCHCDVGGGAVKNEVRHKLSQIPLRWMIRQCFECDTEIIFKTHRLVEEGLDVQNLFPIYKPATRPVEHPSDSLRERFENLRIGPVTQRSSFLTPVDPNNLQGDYRLNFWQDEKQSTLSEDWVPEHAEDYFDAVQDIHDQLKIARTWWILEYWPVKVRVQPKDSDTWVKKVRMNLGRHRPVQDLNPNLHWTVEERMRAKGYEIKTRVDRQAKWKIVA